MKGSNEIREYGPDDLLRTARMLSNDYMYELLTKDSPVGGVSALANVNAKNKVLGLEKAF